MAGMLRAAVEIPFHAARLIRLARMQPIPTSLVGSYAQPDWLIDREKLRGRFPPRVRAKELWRVDPRYIEEAQDDATRVAILDQERAGLDVITDGEMRRESYSNRFATALDGVDVDNPGTALDRSGHPNPVPRVVGPVSRRHPVQVRDAEFLLAHTSRTTKMTVPGPFTMSQQAQDDHYGAPDKVAMAYAAAVREEILDLLRTGIDVVQVDEPYMQARPDAAREYGLDALKAATIRPGSAWGKARRMRTATVSGVSTVGSARSMTPRMIFLPSSRDRTAQSSFDCAVSMLIASHSVWASSGRNE